MPSTKAPRRKAQRIFLSYRREDSAGYAGRLFDSLGSRYGEGSVFMDVDSIRPGVDFEAAVDDAIASCDAVVALIGPRWLDVRNLAGDPRLGDPDDYVRREIETAFAHDVPVVPVLVGQAKMPASRDLPASISKLAALNASEMSDRSWRADLVSLAESVDSVVTASRAQRAAREADVRRQAADEARERRKASAADRTGGRKTRRRLIAVGLLLPVIVVGAILVVPRLRHQAGGGKGRRRTASRARFAWGDIVFQRNGMLFWIRASGGQAQPLTTTGPDSGPSLSPDRTMIAFSRQVGPRRDIYVMNMDGSGLRNVTGSTPSTFNTVPVWSPDGRQIAYVAGSPGQVWLLNLSDDRSGPLWPASDLNEGHPTWSNDGSQIALRVLGAKAGIWVINADGTSPRQITKGKDDSHPAWSPSARTIVFERDRPGSSQLWLVNVDDPSAAHELISPSGGAGSPAWSPTGSQIVFASGDGTLWRIDRDDQNLVQLTFRPEANDQTPTW